MKLYHAGKEEIRKPDLHRGRKNADFGQGFYLTPDREFACRWAYKGYVVNEYELDLTGLNVVSFSRERAWFDYIFKNRRSEDTLTADIVTGPVANDTLYDTLGIISSGFLKPEDALDSDDCGYYKYDNRYGQNTFILQHQRPPIHIGHLGC